MSIPLRILGTPQLTSEKFIRFALHFNRMPDFNTLDSQQRPADSFQIFIAYDPTTPNPFSPPSVNVLIRGDEIHLAHKIRVRDARPPASDPNSGGWGAVRGAVAYRLNAQRDGTARLVFRTPYTLLGIGGPFAYGLEVYHFGSSAGSVQGVVAA